MSNFFTNGKEPKFYGNLTETEKTVTMLNGYSLSRALIGQKPDIILNIAMLLMVTSLVKESDNGKAPDAVINEVADCAVHTLAAYMAWKNRDKEKV